MDVFKVVGIGIIGTVAALILKAQKPEIALQISIAVVAVIFLFAAPYLKAVTDMFEELASTVGINLAHVALVLKVIGVAYVVQFGAELCRDAGEGAIASKIELAGKVALLCMSMPIIWGLVGLITGLIN